MHGSFGPIELIVLQGTSFCNLNCSYCYLSESSRKQRGSMSLEAIESVFSRILASPYVGETLHVSWHSGEPLVLPPDYYRRAIDRILGLKKQLLPHGLRVRFDIQTNGTLIDASWCEFFKDYRDVLGVGVSCDGPDFLHDAHRHTWAGKPTHRQTVRGMDMLRANDIVFDIIAVVSEKGLAYPREFLNFFRPYAGRIGEFHFNLLDEFTGNAPSPAWTARYAGKYERFLESLLSEIRSTDDALVVRNFSSFFEHLLADAEGAAQRTARTLSRPFKTLNIDIAGNVSTFYAGLAEDGCKDIYGDGRGLTVGNLLSQELEDIARSPKLQRIADDFERSHRACESSCEFASVCPGGYNLVKHNRFGTFEATETPECFVHVKTFARVMLQDIERSISPAHPTPTA
ncbi:radical SAM protein [Variovorax sp. dw_308]|uniref:radical SAM protein n=1 Tax=Variovorax sp. dw_308 TaxID=2721546 RepID=UPI001C445574|nr:radical SAM protein [Variovorax sp. dw_308]